MQQFKIFRCRISIPLRSHAILSLTVNPLPPFSSTCIRHHNREVSALPHSSCRVLACTGHVACRTSHFHTTPSSLADDDDDGKKEKKIHTLWRKFATLIQNFTAGVKTLYSDVKLMSEYKQRHGNLVIQKSAPNVTEGGKTDLLYSREELQFMYRTRKDVRKMLPTVILFFIPFLGYFAPVIAFAYPERLLSRHFWTPFQRESLMAARREKQNKSFTSLTRALKEGNSGNDLSFIPQMIDQYQQNGEGTVPSTAVYELSNFSADHREHLYEGWGIRGWLPIDQMLKSQLKSHLEYIFVSDWMIRLEGGTKKLSHSELFAACMERGLDVDLEAGEDESSKDMRRKLDSWIAVSTEHKECPSLLLAYLPIAQYST